MLANPRRGQRVRIHYAPRHGVHMPLQDRVGTVVVVGRGKPRNHGVMVDGELYCVPCGNVVKEEPCAGG